MFEKCCFYSAVRLELLDGFVFDKIWWSWSGRLVGEKFMMVGFRRSPSVYFSIGVLDGCKVRKDRVKLFSIEINSGSTQTHASQ